MQNSSLRRSWQVAIALGFLAALFLGEEPLRKKLDSEFGITEKETDDEKKGKEATDKEIPPSTL